MNVNKFTERVINNELGNRVEVIYFSQEFEKDSGSTYYHTKLLYKNTIIYAVSQEDPGDKEPQNLEKIIKEIRNTIEEFEEIIETDKEQDCISYFLRAIRMRYYKEEFKNNKGNIVYYDDWEEELKDYVENIIKQRGELGLTMIQAYDKCVRNFKEDVVKKFNL